MSDLWVIQFRTKWSDGTFSGWEDVDEEPMSKSEAEDLCANYQLGIEKYEEYRVIQLGEEE
jgi:hypothetical protein